MCTCRTSATADEVVIAALVAVLLIRRASFAFPRWGLGAAWTLAGLSLIGAMVGAGTGH